MKLASFNLMTALTKQHDNKEIKNATYSCVTAANKIGNEVTCLLLGSNCGDVAQNLKNLSGVKKVIYYDNENFKHQIAENLSKQIIELVKMKTLPSLGAATESR